MSPTALWCRVPRWELPFSHPTDAAVAGDGDIYVSDGYRPMLVDWTGENYNSKD
jgi:hypothetical protein